MQSSTADGAMSSLEERRRVAVGELSEVAAGDSIHAGRTTKDAEVGL
jgi:hypothetical protein